MVFLVVWNGNSVAAGERLGWEVQVHHQESEVGAAPQRAQAGLDPEEVGVAEAAGN